MHARDARLLSAAGLGSILVMIGFMEIQAVWSEKGSCTDNARFGRHCTFCGGTRAWRRALRHDLPQAFRYHSTGALVGIATWGLMIGTTGSLITGRLRCAVAGLTLAASLLISAMAYQAWIVWVAFSTG